MTFAKFIPGLHKYKLKLIYWIRCKITAKKTTWVSTNGM